MVHLQLQTDLSEIAAISKNKIAENDRLVAILKSYDAAELDQIIQQLDVLITPLVDCTKCGNCCRSMMITITETEIVQLAAHLNEPATTIKDKYVEQSSQSTHHILNTIPCHFLKENKCTIYEQRFNDCREFPHLHQPNFKARLFSIMMHYEMCPIIFNVIEQLKKLPQFA